MQDDESAHGHPAAQTSGSAQRAAREVSEPVMVLDVPREVELLRREPAWAQGDRNAKTLVKEPDLRVVLTVLKQGASLREHRVPGTATVQVLSGRARLHLASRQVDVSTGGVVSLERDLPHDLEALEESAVLISIAWPAEAPTRGADLSGR